VSSGLGSFDLEVLPLLWVEPEFGFFCLDCEVLLPDLELDLVELDFCSDLFLEELEVPDS